MKTSASRRRRVAVVPRRGWAVGVSTRSQGEVVPTKKKKKHGCSSEKPDSDCSIKKPDSAAGQCFFKQE